ncbi:amino acid ABC transporter permease [Paenibacillus apiarius]|uniref:Amino acid ABC transporter permease n=1 Tax=Paenibacillus apiarius TaxID=46240 RepID=A0ABT4DQN8_9BACL|nr:amino acid ABC transporter permease [Paenibacillus apiarius]MCY9514028.1 amino acid ABC transporter permease [Paenibacillus apiarius]MCY9519545.1 amino acid ABC transporter permease [Paenibacillus apiarius]MCY9552472.1 amino acid ABC transporter permease [Paenibacillus apiarius]MCY9556301.1 amino acid ABC transporter permease [Paenibacillus apiarius]MCY9681835.1 amino acid ABC transporter permease [Paenibacillus apiarius]
MPKLFDLELVFSQIPQILKYLPVTLGIAFASMILSLLIGLATALIKIKQIPVLRTISAFYVSFMRGTPIIVQLYLTFYAVPMVMQYINYYYGTNYNTNSVPPILFVLLTFALNEGAYNSESIRAAIQSVDKGGIEAGYSMGMTTMQVLRRIILPEAIIVALPTLGNSLIGLIKGTSLAFVCSVVEMTAAGKLLASRNFRFFEMYVSLSIIYWIVTILLERLIGYWEKRLKVNERSLPADDSNQRLAQEIR